MKRLRKVLALTLAVLLLAALVPSLQAQEKGKININKASIEEIAQLDRIGVKYAARVVKYREENGLFKAPEDIINVKGIGPKTLEANRDRITVE